MGHGLTININKTVLLEKLQENKKLHQEIVKEAKIGFLAKAEAELLAKLEMVKSGVIKYISVALQPPVDYTAAYDTAIGMLTLCNDDVITLTTVDYQKFVEDQWEWERNFLAGNSAYSDASRRALASKWEMPK